MKEVTLTELYGAIVDLTAALKENTASKATVAQSATKIAETTEKVAKTVEADTKEQAETDGIQLREVEAALLEVKAKYGAGDAQKLLKSITGSTSVKKADPEQYQAILDACEAKLGGAEVTPEPEKEAELESSDVDYGDRNEMEALISELAQSEAGGGVPENFETAKRLIKEVGKANKKANIADENIQPMIDALKEALAALNADDEDDL